MEEQLISLETAKLAKEKGFDIPTQRAYINNNLFVNFESSNGNERDYYFDADDFYNNWNKKDWVFNVEGCECFGCKLANKKWFVAYSAPTQSLLQKWIREVHKLQIYIEPIWENDERETVQYAPWLVYTKEEEDKGLLDEDEVYYDTYEAALEAELIEALNTLPNK